MLVGATALFPSTLLDFILMF